ncbi:hypothetical protein DICSQDRAFT_108392 [Dichomitus squalens LYAD-421 SS1]|uniref:Oxidoreductase AflY n=1 Tax=Dichomitus squalens (strain LYAD-421) TaxID=732165 RepID=R7SXT0_DICSQ|nr:uncharacterized protein DICSQDRAFT_108392 [Dichomitus squalens LYAD-421 SS1]EJF59777.1 hypothetical protein DICSQDRAFT_108392 [Dichomitus squalens LYAD-421 SS1]
MSPRTTELDRFFPLPSEAPSNKAPVRLAGFSHKSGEALAKVLQDNHIKWHAFFNDLGFHNHASHHLVAIYALGANSTLVEAAYQTHVEYMRPAFESPEPVNATNVWKHLGKREFYNSYLEFFRDLLLKRDVTAVLEEYIFSAKANIGGSDTEGQPRMLNRFFAALVHPMIHTGNGLEIGMLGLVAEGLAQAATHGDDGDRLIPPSLFESQSTSAPSAVARLTALLPSLTLSADPSANGKAPVGGKKAGIHAFTALARILADPRFAPAALGLPIPQGQSHIDRVQTHVGEALIDIVAEWAAELEGDDVSAAVIAKKIEEVAWLNALIYGVGGWGGRQRSQNKEFNADFFSMHLVTSSIFLPSLVAYLSPRSATILLRGYFTFSLAWYIGRGRPAIPVRAFYEGTTDKLVPPGEPQVAPADTTLTPEDVSPNPWLPIIQSTLVHPSEHLCKLQRALLHNATVYGARGAGEFAGTELEGAELLDGTLFIRAAGLTANAIGWLKEGQKAREWDRSGFY